MGTASITVLHDSRSAIARLHDETADHQADLDELNACYDRLTSDLEEDFSELLVEVHAGANDTLAQLHQRFDQAEAQLDQLAARRFILPAWARRGLRLGRQAALFAAAGAAVITGAVMMAWVLFQAVTR